MDSTQENIEKSISSLPELVRDSRLDTIVGEGSITHLYRDRPGPQATTRHERWNIVKGALGKGSFGIVSLFEASGEHDQPDRKRYRAVKHILGPPAERLEFYQHELEAITKFSREKVY